MVEPDKEPLPDLNEALRWIAHAPKEPVETETKKLIELPLKGGSANTNTVKKP